MAPLNAIFCAALVTTAAPVLADEAAAPLFAALDPEYAEFYGSFQLETTRFADDPAFAGQERDGFSLAFEPTFLAEWRGGDLAFTLTPFFRYDGADDARSHADLRVAKIDYRSGDYELTVGADYVFWGRTEAVQLVDIINFTDGVEGLDGEDKLGQPMIRLTRLTDLGAFSGYYMPVARQQTYPGASGRLRASIPVTGDAVYRNGAEAWAPSFALRWEHVVGDFDLGAHGFQGVSRDPALEVSATDGFGAPTALRPVYDTIWQLGLDGQYTSGPALWKLESIARFDQLDRNLERTDYAAVTAGVEYTLFGVFESNADLGLILEGAYDSRGDAALSPFDNDAVAGFRLALNDEADTAVLATTSVDVEDGSTSFRIEAERRIFEAWKAEIEGSLFLDPDDGNIEADLRDDSFIRLKLSYFF